MPLPYFEAPSVEIGPIVLRPFPVLMSAGILTAHLIMVRRARRLGLDTGRMGDLSLTMVVVGLVGAGAFKFLYHLEVLRLDWWTIVTKHLAIASLGGILGGLLGAVLFFRWTHMSPDRAWRFIDVAAFAFPFGWIFGRTACAVVHDHPGLRSDSWLAVAYPGGARYDLGLIEVLYFIPMIGVFLWLDRQEKPAGFFLALFLCLYGPFRIALDQLHVDPPRYFGIPVDTWTGCLIAAAGTLIMARRVLTDRFLVHGGDQ